MEDNLLEKYLYMGMAFSTMKLNGVDVLCMKYETTLFKFRKKKYLKMINDQLTKSDELATLQMEFTPYYIHKEIDALKEATLFVDIDDKATKLLKKVRNKDVEETTEFSVSLLPENLSDKQATFIFRDFNQIHKYTELVDKFEKTNVIVIDSILIDNKANDTNEDLMDLLKLQILKDEGDFFFVSPDCYYSNQTINFIYSLNKIAVSL